MYRFVISLLIGCSLIAETPAETALKPYKEFLEWGTYHGVDWSSFPVLPKSRYDTFKTAFDLLEGIGQPVVVELGTSRSFTHGGHPGCNLDDTKYWTPHQPENWDWGAGFFTRMAAISLAHLNPAIHTVDISPNHIKRCKIMTKDFRQYIKYYIASSENFLHHCNFPDGIDLLYLDTGDMTPIEPTAQLQLREAQIIVERNLIAKNGLILIDDVKNQTPKQFGETSDLGKSKYSLTYLLDNGFEILMDEYQVLLRKK
jgi:hypothetical protein